MTQPKGKRPISVRFPQGRAGIAGLSRVNWLYRLSANVARGASAKFREKRPTVMSVARVYADVNAQKPREYWDYDNFELKWG